MNREVQQPGFLNWWAIFTGLVALVVAGFVSPQMCAPHPPDYRVAGTDRLPLVEISGRPQQLPAGDNVNVGTGALSGAIVNQNGAQVFSVAGTGMSATGATINCSAFTSGTPGCVPLSGGGTANFMRADGTWAAPPGGGGIGGSGTTNTLTKWAGASSVGNAGITDDGTTVSTAENAALSGLTTINDLIDGNPQSPAALASGNNNNYNPTSWAASSRWSLTGNAAGSTLTGFTATVDGDTKILSNLGTSLITITNQDANSSLNNRVITPANGQPYYVGVGSTVTIQYNGTNNRWYIKAASDSFSPTFGDVSLQSQSPVTLGAGLTSNWSPFTPNQSFVIASPNAAAGAAGGITSTDTMIDGMIGDGQNAAPIGGALRVICHSSISHGPLVIVADETSASSAANRFFINADGNAWGTSMALAHRQCALFVYNQDRSRWQPVVATDGALRRFSISGYFTDTSLTNGTITAYDAGGTASTHLCGLTRLRWASAGATAVNGFCTCNPGDIKQIQVFGGGITLKQNSGTLGTACNGGAAAPFFLPGSVDKALVNGCTYWLQYDGPNAGWYIVMTSQTSGLAC